LKYAELVQSTSSLTLAQGNDYINMYRTASSTGESILRLDGTDQSGKLKTFYDTSVVPADTLIGLYNSNDIRLQLLRTSANEPYCYKYYFLTTPQALRDDPFVLRLSEIYLNKAEAYCHQTKYADARNCLKDLLKRAVDETYADGVLAQYTDDKLLDLVKLERVRELCAEGHNFFDIVRWKQDLVRAKNTNSTIKYLKYPSNYFVLPIPQTELDADHNMQPNPTVNK